MFRNLFNTYFTSMLNNTTLENKEVFESFVKEHSRHNLEYLNTDKLYRDCENFYNTELKNQDLKQKINNTDMKLGKILNIDFDRQSSYQQIHVTRDLCSMFNGGINVFENTKYDI